MKDVQDERAALAWGKRRDRPRDRPGSELLAALHVGREWRDKSVLQVIRDDRLAAAALVETQPRRDDQQPRSQAGGALNIEPRERSEGTKESLLNDVFDPGCQAGRTQHAVNQRKHCAAMRIDDGSARPVVASDRRANPCTVVLRTRVVARAGGHRHIRYTQHDAASSVPTLFFPPLRRGLASLLEPVSITEPPTGASSRDSVVPKRLLNDDSAKTTQEVGNGGLGRVTVVRPVGKLGG